MKLWLMALVLLLAPAGTGQVWAGSHLDSLPPNVQYYNKLKGEPRFRFEKPAEPESMNVRLVGKWGRGPAAKVTGRDSLVFMALGSEIAIFNAADGSNPKVISEIQCRYVVDRAILKDSLLYAVLQGGLEVFNIADPTHPRRIRYLPLSLVDMCITDSFAYTIDTDSFKVYRIVSPESLQRLGACADSGFSVTAAEGFGYVCDRWGLSVIDATDPTRPKQAAVIAGGNEVGAAWVDSGYCYYTVAYPSASFRIADVTDPYHPSELGHRDGIAGYDIYKISFYVYLPGFQIVNVSTPSSPAIIGDCLFEGIKNGVWTRSPFSFCFVAAGFEGLAAVNISDPVHPFEDTAVAGADICYDVCSDGDWAYAADYYAGMKVLSTSDPTEPLQVGSYDTTTSAPQAYCVRVSDSFAYLGTQNWSPTGFRVISVSDHTNPTLLASCEVWNPGNAMAVRDSLAYLAEDYKLEVFSIANPRNPRLVGSCAVGHAGTTIWLADTLAYANMSIFNIKDPANPFIVGSFGEWPYGNCVKDTFAYLAINYGGLQVYSVANPTAPRLIDTVYYPRGYDVIVGDSLLYFGGLDVRVLKLDNPAHPREIGRYSTPGRVFRLFYSAPYIYAACFGAGVCILETTGQTAVAESITPQASSRHFRLFPNPASSRLRLIVGEHCNSLKNIKIRDIAGRTVVELPALHETGTDVLDEEINIEGLPEGCYFVDLRPSFKGGVIKFTKVRGDKR